VLEWYCNSECVIVTETPNVSLSLSLRIISTLIWNYYYYFKVSLPDAGIGQCVDRDNLALYTERDDTPGSNAKNHVEMKKLFQPQNIGFYGRENFLGYCLEADIAMDVFLCPLANQYIDVRKYCL
jgi:hypothetical protein